jgi:hypothetical protein
MSIFPLQEGKWYSLGQLREGVKAVFNRADFDKEFRHAMRENDQRRVPWAKAWNEEIRPSSLLADRLGLADDVMFCWTPNGAADVEFRSTERAIKIQCTTAYPHWPNSLGEQGGHLFKLEMRQLNEKGCMFPGGGVSKTIEHDVGTDLETLRVAIADALAKKIEADYRGCWLLIYACGATSAFLDFDFCEVVVPATDRVGRAKWEAVFEGLYILGDQPANFAEVRSNRGQ